MAQEIHKENLIIALVTAIEFHRNNNNTQFNPTDDERENTSILVAGWREVLDSVNNGEQLIIIQ